MYMEKIKETTSASQDLDLTLLLADYHRTRPILSGEVTIPGIRFKTNLAAPGDACMSPVYEQYDIAEMSLSWYMMARCRGEPVIALPVFPLRMPIHPYLFCATSSGIERPEDLRGKRIGMDEYRLTVGLWARGILQEYHGVRPEECEWITAAPEGAGFKPSPGVKITVKTKPCEELLLRGEIDAAFTPLIPMSFRRKDARIRRIFKDVRRSVTDYHRNTGFFPITHVLVMRQALFDAHPSLPARLLKGFEDAEARCRESYEYAKRLAFPGGVLVIEEEEEIFGENPWTHGLTAQNRALLAKFIQYAREQGYIDQHPRIDDLFAPV
ncbi:MAG: ABC transporter substrate-binding protein [Burkholderiales bacterium]